MFLGLEKKKEKYTRKSKLGLPHEYYREKTYANFRCDNCKELFVRAREDMSPKRLSNNFYHVCSNCDAKKFAQSKGIESRKIWDMPASSLKKLGKF
jgi:formylmethanofuran dehydrogenase subunit E